MINYNDNNAIEEKLKRPFSPSDIEWRIQQSGISNGRPWALALVYVTNRAIMDRLDEVFGVDGWKNEFLPAPSMQGVMCGISARISGEWIVKYDGADNTLVEAIKGGLSSAMKRTGVQWGIGRYLYGVDSSFVTVVDKTVAGAKKAVAKYKGNNGDEEMTFYYVPPELPPWALPITKEQLKLIGELLEQKGLTIDAALEHFALKEITNATKEVGTKISQELNKKPDKKKEDNEQNS